MSTPSVKEHQERRVFVFVLYSCRGGWHLRRRRRVLWRGLREAESHRKCWLLILGVGEERVRVCVRALVWRGTFPLR